MPLSPSQGRSPLLICGAGPYSAFISLMGRRHAWHDKICSRFGVSAVNSVMSFKADSQLIIFLTVIRQLLNTKSSVLPLHSPRSKPSPGNSGGFSLSCRKLEQIAQKEGAVEQGYGSVIVCLHIHETWEIQAAFCRGSFVRYW